MECVRHELLVVDAAENGAGVQVGVGEPALQIGESFGGQVGEASIAEFVGFGFADQDRAGPVDLDRQVIDLQLDEFGAATERVVSDGDQGAVAQAAQVGGAGADDLLFQCARKAKGLLLTSPFLTKYSSCREINLLRGDRVLELQ